MNPCTLEFIPWMLDVYVAELVVWGVDPNIVSNWFDVSEQVMNDSSLENVLRW